MSGMRFVAGLGAVAAVLLGPPAVTGQESSPRDPGVLRGEVHARSPDGSGGLAHAWVDVADGRASTTAVTDSTGGYLIPGIRPGMQSIQVQRLGYRPFQIRVRVPAGDTLRLDLELGWEPVALAGLTVRADRITPIQDVRRADPDRQAELGLRALEAAPGLSSAGIDAAARRLSAAEGGEPPDRVLLMRGSTTDQKLVLLDGAPVYTPFHLGALVQGFDPNLLSGARHFVGGAPARYDGGLSYILDLSTRPGRSDGVHGSASLDLLSGDVTLEGPLGSAGSVLLSGRALHDLGAPVLDADGTPFGYGDLLVRGDLRLAPNHLLAATGFWNREEVRLEIPDPVAIAERGVRGNPAPLRPGGARWGNEAISLRYQGAWSETETSLTLAGSRYRAGLPLSGEGPAVGRARTDRIRAGAEVLRDVGAGTLHVGASAEVIEHASSATAVIDDTLSEASNRTRSEAFALHLEGSRPAGSSVELRGGLRLDHFPGAGGLRLAPRATLAWLLTDDATLRLSAGRFHQLPRGTELEMRVALDDPAGVEAGHRLYPPAEATHLVVSLDQDLTSTLDLGLEGYLKGFRGLPELGNDDVLRSSGVDLRVMRDGDRLSGWLGYSLAWFWEVASDPADGDTGEFSGRHLISAGLDGRIHSSFGAAIRTAYGDGLPFTSLPVLDRAAAPMSTRGRDTDDSPAELAALDQIATSTTHVARRAPALDGFLRIDVELFADWPTRWPGDEARLRPYLRIMNAVSRRDALFYYFEPWRSDELRALAERPLLPVLGVELQF